MPFYHSLGVLPPKRHTIFKQPNGDLYYEQVFGTIGFEGMSTNLYHYQRPTQVKDILGSHSVAPKIAILAAPEESTKDYFYKNSDADELIFVHRGQGKFRSHLGNIDFEYGDYLLIPRGTIYKLDFETNDNKLFIVESRRPIYTPKKYRNWFGQLLEHSPFCERDFRAPSELEAYNENGEFLIKIKKQNEIFDMMYGSHPFDVVGYDGFNFPYAFSTQSIPAPYNHSNIDSDEVMYYVDGDFMSRNDIAPGHISLHPSGIPHGPHPGAVERSIGKSKTEELAVMVDTFEPLMLTEQAMKIADENYYNSWLNS